MSSILKGSMMIAVALGIGVLGWFLPAAPVTADIDPFCSNDPLNADCSGSYCVNTVNTGLPDSCPGQWCPTLGFVASQGSAQCNFGICELKIVVSGSTVITSTSFTNFASGSGTWYGPDGASCTLTGATYTDCKITLQYQFNTTAAGKTATFQWKDTTSTVTQGNNLIEAADGWAAANVNHVLTLTFSPVNSITFGDTLAWQAKVSTFTKLTVSKSDMSCLATATLQQKSP